MRICYIPSKNIVLDLPGTNAARNYIENAIEEAISNVIVKPFQQFCYNTWCGIVDVSLPVCTTVSLVSLIFYMIGVKKARQWIIIPIIIYLFIQTADCMIGGSH